MAAQRMPLGHKRRGEAARANARGPGGRTLRERYAYGVRHSARDFNASIRVPASGGSPAAPSRRRVIVRDFTN